MALLRHRGASTLRRAFARPMHSLLSCAAVGIAVYGDVRAADIPLELPARADGIYIENHLGSLTYYYFDIQHGLEAGLQVRCANPVGWGLLNPSGCTLIGAEEQISYLGSSLKMKSRFLISAQYQNSNATDSPMLT